MSTRSRKTTSLSVETVEAEVTTPALIDTPAVTGEEITAAAGAVTKALTGADSLEKARKSLDNQRPTINASYTDAATRINTLLNRGVTYTAIEAAARAANDGHTAGASKAGLKKFATVGFILAMAGSLPVKYTVAPIAGVNGIEGECPVLTDEGKILRNEDDGAVIVATQRSIFTLVTKALGSGRGAAAAVDKILVESSTKADALKALEAMVAPVKAPAKPKSIEGFVKSASGPLGKVANDSSSFPLFDGDNAEEDATAMLANLDLIEAAVREARALIAAHAAAAAAAPAA